jgi:hypothetical protein
MNLLDPLCQWIDENTWHRYYRHPGGNKNEKRLEDTKRKGYRRMTGIEQHKIKENLSI